MKPQLRFKEFTDDWEEKKLGEIVESFDYGLGVSAITYNGQHKYIRITDIDDETHRFIDNDLKSPNESDEKILERYKVNENDILFARTGATTGKSYLYNLKDGDLYFAGFLIRAHIKKEIANSYFVYSQTLLPSYDKWIKVMSMRTGQPGINAQQYQKLTIQLPSFPEQEKIGKFFSLLDQRIEKQERKVALLEEEKKGYMQKLFKQELRFKDEQGKDYPDWEENYISQVGEIITGNTPSKNNKNYYSEICGYPWITPSDITDKKDIETSKLYLTEEGYQKARKLPINTLLITCIASIGKNAILKQIGSCNQQINAIIPYETYSIDFLYYLLSHFSYVIELNAGQTATKIINKTDFSTLKFKIPSLKEQEKIANFLSLLDERIEKEQEKLKLMREEKKGLMQRMFV